MYDMKTLGENIRHIRKIRGLTQENLARKAGLSTMSIRRYENGERVLTEKVLVNIANALDVSSSYLFGWENVISQLRAVGLSVDDVVDEMNISKEHLSQIINSNDVRSVSAMMKVICVATALINEVKGQVANDYMTELIKSTVSSGKVSVHKMTEVEQYRAGFLQFHSDEDRIAYFYRLLNEDGKLAAGVCFFKYLDKDTYGKVADYVMSLCENPLYQRTDIPQSAQMPKEGAEPAPQPPAEVEEGKDTGPDQEAPETTENKESG